MNKAGFNWISAGLALLAAIAWIISAFVKIPEPSTGQFMTVSNEGMSELARKLRLQSGWSATAAFLAALAAIAQVLAIISN
jgi:hypothetical protein